MGVADRPYSYTHDCFDMRPGWDMTNELDIFFKTFVYAENWCKAIRCHSYTSCRIRKKMNKPKFCAHWVVQFICHMQHHAIMLNYFIHWNIYSDKHKNVDILTPPADDLVMHSMHGIDLEIWPWNILTFAQEKLINSPAPSATYICQWTKSALVQMMACRLIGAKPLSKSMLEYC